MGGVRPAQFYAPANPNSKDRARIQERRNPLKRLVSVLIAICVAASLNLMVGSARAEDAGQSGTEARDLLPGKGLDPSVCTKLQNQIDHVMSIANSSQTNADKVTQLSQVLSQAMVEMSGRSQNDSDISKIVKQYQFFIQSVLTAALAAGGADQNVSGPAKDELQKLKIMTSSYVAMAKILCPNVKLPDVIDK
jgi:hypothetical protein